MNFVLKLATNVEQSFYFIMLQKLFDLVEYFFYYEFFPDTGRAKLTTALALFTIATASLGCISYPLDVLMRYFEE